MESRERLHELDSLRGIAALGVVCWHYTNMWHGAKPLSGIFEPFYVYGLVLVDFFFVLSGFVLARAYWNDRRHGTIGRNLIDRFARVYPLHFVTLFAVVAIQLPLQHLLGPLDYLFKYNDAYHFVLNLFLLNRSSLERGFSFNSPAWSISTEMIVNVLFFAFILMGRKKASIFMAAVWIVSACVIAKHGLITNERAFGVNPDIYRTCGGFFLGVGLYAALETRVSTFLRRHGVLCDIAWLLAIAGVLSYMVYFATVRINPAAFSFTLFPIIIATAVSGRFVQRLLSARPLAYLGEISYSIYLIHFPLLMLTLLAQTLLGIEFPYGSPVFVIAFLSMTVLVAALSHRYVEIPGKVAIKKLMGARNRTPAPQPN